MSKYNAIPKTVDGVTFHSTGEANRYQELKLLQKGRKISCLELQPRFRLEVNGKLVCTYIADFRYTENGKTVIEDYKGIRTSVYSIKKKLMKAIHGIEIRETRAK